MNDENLTRLEGQLETSKETFQLSGGSSKIETGGSIDSEVFMRLTSSINGKLGDLLQTDKVDPIAKKVETDAFINANVPKGLLPEWTGHWTNGFNLHFFQKKIVSSETVYVRNIIADNSSPAYFMETNTTNSRMKMKERNQIHPYIVKSVECEGEVMQSKPDCSVDFIAGMLRLDGTIYKLDEQIKELIVDEVIQTTALTGNSSSA